MFSSCMGVIGVTYPYFTLFNYISSKFYMYYSHCQFFVLIIANANFCMHYVCMFVCNRVKVSRCRYIVI